MRYLTSLALLSAAAVCCGQEVKMPQTVQVAVGRLAAIPMTYDGSDFKYAVSPELDAFREYTTDPKEVRLRVLAYKPGMYTVTAVTCKDDKLSELTVCLVVVGSVVPEPTEPVPPVNPPQPAPPAPLAGMRVLMLYESDAPLPKDVQDAMFSPAVDEYLRLKCLMGPDGKTPERRRFDDDPPVTGMSKAWQDLRAKLPANLPLGPDGTPVPHVAVGDSSGAVRFAGPFTFKTEAEALAFFKQYGG